MSANNVAGILDDICSFCLKNEENLSTPTKTIKDILLLLNIKFRIIEQTQICEICSDKLFTVLNFKTMCVSTDATIIPYVIGKTVKIKKLPFDLKEIYVSENGIEILQSLDIVNENICRLCMQVIKGKFVSFQEIEMDLIDNYIPEVNFEVTKDPVICQTCLERLVAFREFSRACYNAQNTIVDMCLGVFTSNMAKKTKKLSETNDDDDDIISLTGPDEAEEAPQLTSYLCDCCIDDSSKSYKQRLLESTHTNSIYYCGFCDFNIDSCPRLMLHMRTKHETSLRTDTIWCDICDFKTGDYKVMKSHMLRHMYVPRLYQCDKCLYVTDSVQYFNIHKSSHADPATRQIYQCAHCGNRFARKSYLKKHLAMHSAPRSFKCSLCDHVLRTSAGLRMHMNVTHRDAPFLKCYSCDYQTKFRSSLVMHVKTHREGRRRERRFLCTRCGHRSYTNAALELHELTHADPSQVDMFKCYHCTYEAKSKFYLTLHIKHRHMKRVSKRERRR